MWEKWPFYFFVFFVVSLKKAGTTENTEKFQKSTEERLLVQSSDRLTTISKHLDQLLFLWASAAEAAKP